jgi:superoxide dismutase, Fe-Mn family
MATVQPTIVLPPLPYERQALEPYMSRETLDYHYGKHHKAYVDKLNRLLEDSEHDASLEELVRTTSGALFDNAAQAWNHGFFWNCLSPRRQEPAAGVLAALKSFGGIEPFKAEFTKAAAGVFGSGWAWLVKDRSGGLRIVTTANANTPLRDGLTPLLTCDVWEHAYYIDHRNDRGGYLESFWQLVNWRFVADNLGRS